MIFGDAENHMWDDTENTGVTLALHISILWTGHWVEKRYDVVGTDFEVVLILRVLTV